MTAINHQTRIVLLAEELETRGVFEGVDIILLRKFDGERAFESIEVREEEVEEGGAGCVFEEESGARVFGGLWGFVVEVALRAGILGFDLADG